MPLSQIRFYYVVSEKEIFAEKHLSPSRVESMFPVPAGACENSPRCGGTPQMHESDFDSGTFASDVRYGNSAADRTGRLLMVDCPSWLEKTMFYFLAFGLQRAISVFPRKFRVCQVLPGRRWSMLLRWGGGGLLQSSARFFPCCSGQITDCTIRGRFRRVS